MRIKKALKRVLIGTLVLVVVLTIAGFVAFRQLVVPGENQYLFEADEGTIPMMWVASASNPNNPRGAILVPVTLPGVERTFSLQLDLGHPTTTFYRPQLEAIEQRFGPGTISSDGRFETLHNFTFRVGTVPVRLKQTKTLNYGGPIIDWDNPKQPILIGTLGSDFIEHHTILIDYPKMVLTWSATAPGSIPADQLHEFAFNYRRIILPMSINGKATKLMFDSGSSMYELITDRQTWETLAVPGSETVNGKANSWGKLVSTYTRPTDAVATFGPVEIPIQHVTRMDGIGFWGESAIRMTGLTGMTGNKLFEKNRLFIDVKNLKYAILD